MTSDDLKSIKQALLFLIEKEFQRELGVELKRTNLRIFRTPKDRVKAIEKVSREVGLKYQTLLKELKE